VIYIEGLEPGAIPSIKEESSSEGLQLEAFSVVSENCLEVDLLKGWEGRLEGPPGPKIEKETLTCTINIDLAARLSAIQIS